MQPTAEASSPRKGLGRDRSPPNSWPSSAATNTRNRTSLRAALGRAWPGPLRIARKSGVDPAGFGSRRCETFISYAAAAWVAGLSLFFCRRSTRRLDAG